MVMWTEPTGNICLSLKAIKPVFETLSTDSLLSKCTHGGTQNSNESFHHLIWYRCPKNVFVGRIRLEVAVYDAAIVHNEGEMRRLPIFQMLSLEQGAFMKVGFLGIDRKRVLSAEKQATEAANTSRKRRQVVQAGTSTSDGSYEAFKRSFLHFVFWSRACSLMSIYLEKLLIDVCENWHIVEEVGLKLLILFSYL